MSNFERTLKKWSDAYHQPAKLNQNQSAALNGLSVLFLVMAILQLASFDEFKAALSALGLDSGPETWAVAIMLAEFWAAIGLLSVRMNGLMRAFGRMFAVLAASFWFVLALQSVVTTDEVVANSAFFGNYFVQAPGWWTVIEATALMGWTIYALEVTQKK